GGETGFARSLTVPIRCSPALTVVARRQSCSSTAKSQPRTAEKKPAVPEGSCVFRSIQQKVFDEPRRPVMVLLLRHRGDPRGRVVRACPCAAYFSSATVIAPEVPSTVTIWPVVIRWVVSGTPTTAGMPYSRATTADDRKH